MLCTVFRVFTIILFIGDGPEEVPIEKIKVEDAITTKGNDIKKEATGENEVVGKTHLNRNVQKNSNQQSSESSIPTNTSSKCRNTQNAESNRHPRNKGPNATATNYKQSHKSQLLQRLLSRSIQHERNLICQCIKYIVDNNFFD